MRRQDSIRSLFCDSKSVISRTIEDEVSNYEAKKVLFTKIQTANKIEEEKQAFKIIEYEDTII